MVNVNRTWTQPPATANAANPLAVALAEYAFLETLVSHLPPDDLVILTQTSQVLHGHIRMHGANAKAYLLTKTLCPGMGFAARNRMHCPCTVKTFDLTMGCRRYGLDIESRPCAKCGINTCDECRIHVFYNPLTEDPGLDQHSWWAGYLFLDSHAIAAYPPKNTNDKAWHLPIDEMKPLHDQGRFHIPLHMPAIGDPEPIDRILDMNLGRRRIVTPFGRTASPFYGLGMVSQLNLVVTRRKEPVCGPCYERKQAQSWSRCSCTLCKRFLDRWVCIQCYLKEDDADRAMCRRTTVHDDRPYCTHRLCGCGANFADDYKPKVQCNWCKGEIVVDQEEDVTDAEKNAKDNKDEEDEDEEHSAADFAGSGTSQEGFARNRDGTFSVYTRGHCYRGERLSRALVRQAIAAFKSAGGVATL